MNHKEILFHLKEAREELDHIISECEDDSQRINDDDLLLYYEHLYHHINYFWNIRNLDPDFATEKDGEMFYVWRSFPTDIDMGP